jgi:predicted MFS family arabinose efflux permease
VSAAAAAETEAPGGWTAIAAIAAAQVVSWGSIYYTFSLFVGPMERDLGWDRATLNGALSLGLLMAGLASMPFGAGIDRGKARLVMSACSLAAALLFWLWSGVHSVTAFYLLWAGLGVTMAGTLYEPAFAVITRRFPLTYRNRIAAVTLAGGFASTVFIPLGQFFIETLGWRDALVALGLCNLLVALPVHLFAVGDGNGRNDAPPAAPPPGTLARALRRPAFWGLAVAWVVYSGAFSAVTFHLVPLLSERGFAMAAIVGIFALIGPAQVAGRIVLLALGRRLGTALAGQIVFVAFPLSLLPLIWHGPLWSLVAFALLYGAANGIMTIVRGAIVPELLGREGYGAISGAISMPSMIAKAGAPLGAALLWQWAGYDAVLWTVLAGGVVAALGFRFAVGTGR